MIGGCDAQPAYRLWYITAHGSCQGETEYIQALQDGPIVVGMCVTDEFENYQGFAIYNDTTGCTSQVLFLFLFFFFLYFFSHGCNLRNCEK